METKKEIITRLLDEVDECMTTNFTPRETMNYINENSCASFELKNIAFMRAFKITMKSK